MDPLDEIRDICDGNAEGGIDKILKLAGCNCDRLRSEIKKLTDKLESVLCDPEGHCSIDGSRKDKQIIEQAIRSLRKMHNGE